MTKTRYINAGLRSYINPIDSTQPLKPGDCVELGEADAKVMAHVSQGEVKPLERYVQWLELQPDARLVELTRLRGLDYTTPEQARLELSGQAPKPKPPTKRRKKT